MSISLERILKNFDFFQEKFSNRITWNETTDDEKTCRIDVNKTVNSRLLKFWNRSKFE